MTKVTKYYVFKCDFAKKYRILEKNISWGNFWCYFVTFTALFFLQFQNRPTLQHQTVCQKSERIGNFNTGCENIHLWYIDRIWLRKIWYANWKRQTTEGIELSNQQKIRRLREKKSYKSWRILEADPIKQARMKEKKNKRIKKKKRIKGINT